MSGECLCGAFAKPNELEEIAFWFPDVAQEIHDLEHEVAATGKFKPERCRWGWGHQKGAPEGQKAGGFCSSCTLNGAADKTVVAAM